LSATGRGAERADLDFYETPSSAILPALALLQTVRGQWPDSVSIPWHDPGCGTGAILKQIAANMQPNDYAIGVELDSERREQAQALVLPRTRIVDGDYLGLDRGTIGPRAGISMFNPPYSYAKEFVQAALETTTVVAALLRVNWLGSRERREFLQKTKPGVGVLTERPAFCASVGCKAKCGWRVSLPLEAERPKVCPSCGAKTSCSTTDATEYAWFFWGIPALSGRWFLL